MYKPDQPSSSQSSLLDMCIFFLKVGIILNYQMQYIFRYLWTLFESIRGLCNIFCDKTTKWGTSLIKVWCYQV